MQAGFNQIQNTSQSNILIVNTIGAFKTRESKKNTMIAQTKAVQKIYDISPMEIKLEQNSSEFIKQEYSQCSTAPLMAQQYQQDSDHSSRTGELYNREDSSQKPKKPSQSQVKNANKFYFKKFLNYLLTQKPDSSVISKEQLYELLEKIKKTGNRDNYTLKHFRAVCLKLSEQNMAKMNEQDQKCHEQIFGKIWENKEFELINQIKTTISALILNYIESNTAIEKDIKQKWADQPALIERYRDWSMHLSINIRKMMQGQYVSRF